MIGWVGVGLILALAALLAVLVALVYVLRDIHRSEEKLDKLTSLSLNPRTRFSQASMQSGATVPEQELQRLAHASRAKRVVVGGDEDSEQYRQLGQGIREEESDG